ncbi:hypothetical protein [Kribbella speibonae]|uniref:Uncharacterized protein n=1 Tax=Kribbella speibonae TaxID=1572660 RepID=A0A4R0IVB4_9ACTN|nr:hypothetical protein [Kribbella speibonae]TCC36494.1 hypothetical protein E0H92_28125 [Kribbella speibonae]
MMVSSRKQLDKSADALIRAIKVHAESVGRATQSPEDVMAAVSELQESARMYADAVFDVSGWGNPFGGADEDEDRGDSVGQGVGGKGDIVRVEARYRLLVRNKWEARKLLESRTRIRGEVLSEDLDDDSATDIVTELFRLDSWDPFIYQSDAIDVVDQEWSCVPERHRE